MNIDQDFMTTNRRIDHSMLSVRDVVATRFTPFDKIGEMPADLTGWPGFGQARGREILVFVIRDRGRETVNGPDRGHSGELP